MLYLSGIILLGISPRLSILCTDTCSAMLVATLFIIAKEWKQTECPSLHSLHALKQPQRL